MMQLGSAMVATAIVVASATPVAQSLTAQSGVTWLVFVDDLHLDFGNTGRLRDLLRRLSSELIKDGDNFAVRSTGPSMLSIDVTKDRSLLTPAIKKATGNGLRLSDIERIKTQTVARSEVRYRATVSFAIASEAVRALAQAPAGRRALIYVSNGYHGDEPLRDQVPELTRLAKETGVTIFAVDPRGLSGAIVAEPLVDLAAWKNHLTTTRESLRVLSEPTGGFVVFEAADLADALRRIDAAMRK